MPVKTNMPENQEASQNELKILFSTNVRQQKTGLTREVRLKLHPMKYNKRYEKAFPGLVQ